MNRTWLLAALGLGAAAAIVIGFAVLRPGSTPRIIDYYRIVDQDTIVIGTSGGDDADTRVTDVSETDQAVTITVQSFTTFFGMNDDVAYPMEFAVNLEAPLGKREVFDPHHEVPAAAGP